MEREEAELAPELPVVALLRFLDLREVRLQVLVGEERRPVDRAASAALFASPFQYAFDVFSSLNAFSLAGGRHVRADAEVDERVLVLDRVAGDFAHGPAVFSSISCTLSGSPRLAKKAFASSRGHICRS